MIALFGAVTGWLLFAALVTAVGSVAARWHLVPRAAISVPEAAPELRDAAERLGLLAAIALPVAMIGLFARQMQEFRDPFAPWTEDAGLLLTGTDWGGTWIAATTIAWIALLAFVALRRGRAAAWWIAGPSVVGLSAYPAFSGHASGTGSLRFLTLTADVLHVLAAGAWVGGLAFVLWAERRWRRGGGQPRPSVLPALVRAFSRLAVGAVAVLIASGTLGAWVHLEGPADLVRTPYGRLLTAKLALVAGVLALGAVNWKRLTPRLEDEGGTDALARNAARELVLAQLVLLVTAVLVRTSPMGH